MHFQIQNNANPVRKLKYTLVFLPHWCGVVNNVTDPHIALTGCALGDVAEIKVALQPQTARDDLRGRREGGAGEGGSGETLTPPVSGGAR